LASFTVTKPHEHWTPGSIFPGSQTSTSSWRSYMKPSLRVKIRAYYYFLINPTYT